MQGKEAIFLNAVLRESLDTDVNDNHCDETEQVTTVTVAVTAII